MDDDLVLRVLGEVAVLRDARVVVQASRTRRTVLALLALAPDGLRKERLIAELWPGSAGPKDPSGTLYTILTRVREWLGGAELLRASAGLYVLDVPPGRTDVGRFHRLADAALDPTAPAARVLADVGSALELWRGVPFPGLDAPGLVAAGHRLIERRRRLLEQRVAALLALDRAAEAAEHAADLVVEHPDRESGRALLVDALHRGGRAREATDAYLAARRHLLDELGVEPGEALRAAYRRVLDDRASPARVTAPRPRLVGRDEALAAILDGLSGEGRLLVVDGEAGIGKSTLLAAARHDADAAGATVVAGTSDDAATPLAAWHEALGEPPTHLAAARTAPGPWWRERLGALARDAPVLLTLDDAHKADTASLGVLAALARAGVPRRAVVVVGARAPDTVPRLEWDRTALDVLEAPGAERLRLGELDAPSVRAIALDRLARFGPAAAERLATLVHARAGGHPLHLVALLDVLAPAPDEATPDEAAAVEAAGSVPERLRGMLEHRVARLPTATRRDLEALAVLRPIDLAALAAVLDRPALDVAAGLRPAVGAGLVVASGDRFAMRHDLVADAVRDAVPAVTRAHLHHRRLVALTEVPSGPGVGEPDPFLRLRHTLGAAALLDAATLARARVAAGVAAYRGRALVEALALFDAAATTLPDDPVLAVHRALTLTALGRTAEADRALDAALDLLDAAVAAPQGPDLDGLAVLAAVGDEPLGSIIDGDPRRLARLRRVAARTLPPRTRLELVAALVREEGAHGALSPGLLDEALLLAAAVAGEETTATARVRALEARTLVDAPVPARHRLAVATGALALAHETGDPELVLDATELAMSAALGAGLAEQARERRAVLADDARRRHRPRSMWVADVIDAALLLAEGEGAAADAAAGEALARGQALGVATAPAAFGVHLFLRRWLAGDLAAVRDLAVKAADAAVNTAAWAAAAALCELDAGDEGAARAQLEHYRARLEHLGPDLWFSRAGACFAAAAAFRLRDRGVAASVRRMLPPDPDAVVLVGFGAGVVGPASLFTGLAARTLGEHGTARREIADAVALVTRPGWAPWIEVTTTVARALAPAAPTTLTAPTAPVAELPLALGTSLP